MLINEMVQYNGECYRVQLKVADRDDGTLFLRLRRTGTKAERSAELELIINPDLRVESLLNYTT